MHPLEFVHIIAKTKVLGRRSHYVRPGWVGS